MSGESLESRFVAAWGEARNPELDSENPHFRNAYASLKATMGAVRDACRPHGLAYCQALRKAADGGFELHAFVVSDDGGTLDLSDFPVEAPKNPQQFGSNLTYAKRQQAQSDWGITGESDDDGNAAAAAAARPAARNAGDDAAKRAWSRLLAACAAYEKKHGMEPKKAVEGVKARPDYPDRAAPGSEKAEFFARVAAEFESEL